ncbi:metal-dependent hydrolase [Arcticibacter svalbardensis MN12-7]|uniref:Endoribonuclease YbeY n=1 Tax=Arcticibacter svalbardensis MN12-7 TaxID=1150600 RepID=R9GMK0_9SPHI|nr:rRNA maturation RNase YbeY [Arcticibacter svalbardensis]EOR93062.1 metal-dependent hydrolase [Arcticibacter svalbardensis MN12-7]
MSQEKIQFHSEEITYTLKQKEHIRKWIKASIREEGKMPSEISFIFCSDEYLLNINNQYLKHDTYTDIITFDNSEEEDLIAGDIFISIDRVIENAASFRISEKDEVHRVIIHGILHLLGYTDKGTEHKNLMTSKENYYLSLRTF